MAQPQAPFTLDDNGYYTFTRKLSGKEVVDLAMAIVSKQFMQRESLGSPRDTINYLTMRLAHLESEVFCCIFLDNRNRVIRFETMFQGTINGTAVYSREVVKRALSCNAAAVIFAHNHPSGVAEPSHADEILTQRLKEALALVDVRALDHIVIGGTEAISFSERGLI
jgi:DNA repair protein RadC